MGYQGTEGERRIKRLAEDKGLYLSRARDAFGCAPVWIGEPGDPAADGDDPWANARQAYSIFGAGGELIHCRITLAEAEAYLTTGQAPVSADAAGLNYLRQDQAERAGRTS